MGDCASTPVATIVEFALSLKRPVCKGYSLADIWRRFGRHWQHFGCASPYPSENQAFFGSSLAAKNGFLLYKKHFQSKTSVYKGCSLADIWRRFGSASRHYLEPQCSLGTL